MNFGIQYEPVTIDETERYQITSAEDFVTDFKQLISRFEQPIKQNDLVNIFTNDYVSLAEDDLLIDQSSHTLLQEYQSFTDLKHSKDKSIGCVDWHPTQKGYFTKFESTY